MTHQVGRALELPPELGIRRKLHFVPLRREGLDTRERGPCQQGQDQACRIGSREACGDEVLHLVFAEAPCRTEQLFVVFVRQMLAQQQERRQVDLSTLDHRERHREPADEARSRHASACFVVAHPEPSDAEVEERGACRREIQPSLLDLREMGEQASEDHSPLADERMQTRQQLFVGQSREIHSSLLPSRF
jgi:hypothetical protein